MRKTWMSWCAVAVAVGLGAAPLTPAASQRPVDWDAQQLHLTRADLQALLDRLDQTSSSPAYSGRLRARAREEAERVRARLREGDFQVGDRLLLVVEGEPALSDSFTVEPGPSLTLPQIGAVSLAGVLRAEATDHFTKAIANYLRNPIVRVRTVIRVSVTGQVGKPGFYVFPSNAVLSEALMQAGGPTGSSKMEQITIRRGDEVIWDAESVRLAIAEGRTLDQLSLRGGDVVEVPSSRRPFTETSVRTVLLLLSVPAAILGFIAVFK